MRCIELSGSKVVTSFIYEVVSVSKSSSAPALRPPAVATALLQRLAAAPSKRRMPCRAVLCAVPSRIEAHGTPSVSCVGVRGRVSAWCGPYGSNCGHDTLLILHQPRVGVWRRCACTMLVNLENRIDV